MKNITEILSEIGITVPEDKAADFNKSFSENYKTIAEHEKKIAKVEADRDKYKADAETAAETLKGFEGINLEQIQKELNSYKEKAANAEAEYNKKIEERDFNDILNAELGNVKFSSEYAKKSVMAEIKAAGLKMRDGKIIGLNDMLESIKTADASAFVDEEAERANANKASFTAGTKHAGAKYATKEEIMKIKDSSERQAAIASHIELFQN